MLARLVFAVESTELRKRLRSILAGPDRHLATIKTSSNTWLRLLRRSCDLVIVDRSLIPEPAPESVRALAAVPDAPRIVVLSQESSDEEHACFVAAGCAAVVSVHVSDATLRAALDAVLESRRQEVSRAIERESGPARTHLSDLQAKSPRMMEFLEFVRKVVPTDSTLLLTGETGVGKEHLARAIHGDSPRVVGPFVSVNCGALPESLLESELFGHEEGAFTGATRSRRGWFELAHNGTIFLDEIGELAPHLQVKLLHVLQTKQVQRVGGSESVPVDIRIMAATNKNLPEELAAKRFRADLFYRLSVIMLEIPPLRQRTEDIPGLVAEYRDHFRERFVAKAERFTPAAIERLCLYPWPGNIRELINVVERSLLLAEGSEVEVFDLPRAMQGSNEAGEQLAISPTIPAASGSSDSEEGLDQTGASLRTVCNAAVAATELRYLRIVLKKTRGRVGRAAEIAGIQRRSLYSKMKRYGLSKEEFRNEPVERNGS